MRLDHVEGGVNLTHGQRVKGMCRRSSSSARWRCATPGLPSNARPVALQIPSGCAHGFQVVSTTALVAYIVSTEHSPAHDTGVRWDSVGITWPLADPVVSERDRSFPALAEFERQRARHPALQGKQLFDAFHLLAGEPPGVRPAS